MCVYSGIALCLIITINNAVPSMPPAFTQHGEDNIT